MDTFTLYRSADTGRISSKKEHGGTCLTVRAFTPKQAYFLAANRQVFDGKVGILHDAHDDSAIAASPVASDDVLDTLKQMARSLEALLVAVKER